MLASSSSGSPDDVQWVALSAMIAPLRRPSHVLPFFMVAQTQNWFQGFNFMSNNGEVTVFTT